MFITHNIVIIITIITVMYKKYDIIMIYNTRLGDTPYLWTAIWMRRAVTDVSVNLSCLISSKSKTITITIDSITDGYISAVRGRDCARRAVSASGPVGPWR